MLRAAYFAQELLSTFGTDLDEVALRPVTGGVFTISFSGQGQGQVQAQSQGESQDERVIWDRKTDGGFPEVKVLKARVRDFLDPNRDLGHTDRALKQKQGSQSQAEQSQAGQAAQTAQENTGQTGQTGQSQVGHTEECTDCQ